MLAGSSLESNRWGRPSGAFGAVVVVNDLSRTACQYFVVGSMDALIDDGALNYSTERIAELYYSWAAIKHPTLGLNYQCVIRLTYNRDRGPISIVGVHIHAEF